MSILFGFNAKAYYYDSGAASDHTDYQLKAAYTGGSAIAGSMAHSGTFADLFVFDNIMDLTCNFESESVDTTTRAEAGTGWSSEVFTTNKGTVSFEMRWLPGDTAFTIMQSAWLLRTTVGMVFLDQAKTVNGAQGIAANWSISFSLNQPVKGMQTANVQLSIAQYPDWVTSSGSAFTV